MLARLKGFLKSAMLEADGTVSSSRLLMLTGGILLVSVWLAAVVVIVLGLIAWEQLAGAMDWAKELFAWLLAPYAVNRVARAAEVRQSHTITSPEGTSVVS